MNNVKKSQIIKRYILLNIYMDKWEPGFKLPSIQQLAIRFQTTKSTVKKELIHLKDHNFLVGIERQAFYVNHFLYEKIPLSISKTLNLKKISLDLSEYMTKRKITSVFLPNASNLKKGEEKVYEEIKLVKNVFKYEPYNFEKSLIWNLAFNGFIITKFVSQYKHCTKNGKLYIHESRNFFDEHDQRIVHKDIYIPFKMLRKTIEISL